MLGRIVLFVAQIVLAWALLPLIERHLPQLGQLRLFVFALIFAGVVWFIGILGAVVLKGVARPSPAALTFALVGALIGAGLTMVPGAMTAIAGLTKSSVPILAWPLAGAVMGYTIKR